MHRTVLLTTLSCAVMGGGCSIHPVPQDYTHVNTYQIVAQIRCEVRQSLRDYVEKALRKRPEDAHLADELLTGKIKYGQLISKIKDPDLKGVLLQYASATVGYDFSLDMTESNNVSGSATLTRPFTRGSDTIGFTVGSDHKRENTRAFTIDDTFVRLLTMDMNDYCSGTTSVENFNYPITGKTRLAETVGTFLDLNQSGNLGTKPGGPKTPTLTDDLQFTTTYTGSVSPGFTYTPIGRAFLLSAVSGKVDSTRSDLHRVTIALAMPEKGKPPTPLTIAESRNSVREALENANGNRFSVNLQKISNGFSQGANFSLFSTFFP